MAHDPSAFIQEYFRIRLADTVGLNADSGWAADENTNATIGTGLEFRVRFKVRETAAGADSTGFKLQVNYNSGGWVDVQLGNNDTTAAVIAVPSSQYNDGDATSTELLTNTGTYVNGEGLEGAASSSFGLTSEETEFEWCLMIMNSYDGPNFTAGSETLDLRVVQSDGTVFTGTYTNPTITVSVTDYYLGGTYAESPNKCIWVDGNKNIYALIETAETDPKLLMMKSTDSGKTWAEQDGANRPTQEDMESMDGVLTNDRIYIAHQYGGHEIYHHLFRVSTEGTNPDTWQTTDELVQGTVALNTNPQSTAIVRRSDGDLVIFYIRDNSTLDQAYYRIDTGGGWGSEQTLDTEASHDCRGISAIIGESDKAHIFYTMHDGGTGTMYHRSLDSGDTLSAREEVDASTGIGNNNKWVWTSPIYWDDGGVEIIMVVYKDSDNLLYSVVVSDDGTPETRKAASDNTAMSDPGGTGSQQVTADLALDGTDAYLHYSDLTTQDLFRDTAANDGGWGTDVEELDSKQVDWIRSTSFTHSGPNGGARVVGYVYDNGSDGGTGFIWYDEFVIAEAAADLPIQIVIEQAVNRASTY